MGKSKQKYYVVWRGRKPGIYSTWDECKAQVDGFVGARYKGFESRAEAERAFAARPEDYIRQAPVRTAREQQTEGDSYQVKKVEPARRVRGGSGPRPIEPSLCVDAACADNPGPLEYQCVDYPSMERVFHEGPFANGTNNIGEFLAIVEALRYCDKSRLTLPIYSDSRIAIGWVKAKKCRTKSPREESNAKLFERIADAEKWLGMHKYANRVLKWETDVWGENPADFGRK